jgi:uncharacterized protein YecE (DUF72 family)
MGAVLVGCSGWNYRDWRGAFYPEGLAARDWLEAYTQHFDTVEVNSTFYRLASRDAVARWVEQTPERFVFALKASRYLTHIKRLTDLERGIERFYEPIAPLIESRRLGPVLWQLPGNFKRDDERLAGALRALPAGRHAFEFRHESWFADEVLDRLRRHNVALVIGDDPRRALPPGRPTADFVFIRFHHGRRGRGGNYSERELADWARRIRAWRRGRDVYAYFNNDWKAYAPRNAQTLKRLL